jgi:nitroreductase
MHQTPGDESSMDLDTVDELLTTTRSVRKRLDLNRDVDPAVIQHCLELAIQAPTGSGIPRYHFLVITDANARAQLGEVYRRAFNAIWEQRADEVGQRVEARNKGSFDYLAEHLHEVPVHVIPCVEMLPGTTRSASAGGELTSILPATWSFMLALRARGIGTTLTTIHTMYEEEVAEMLGVPEHIRQVALLPVAHFTGERFKPARRAPARERTYWGQWGRTADSSGPP